MGTIRVAGGSWVGTLDFLLFDTTTVCVTLKSVRARWPLVHLRLARGLWGHRWSALLLWRLHVLDVFSPDIPGRCRVLVQCIAERFYVLVDVLRWHPCPS